MIVQKIDNPDRAIVLDSITEIYKGNTLYTNSNSYDGWAVLNFKTASGELIQWDYGRTSEESIKLRDEQYIKIIKP